MHALWAAASRLFEELSKLQTLGVALPGCSSGSTRCYTLRYGGEVPQDGNCLFEALALALGGLETGAQVCNGRLFRMHAQWPVLCMGVQAAPGCPAHAGS